MSAGYMLDTNICIYLRQNPLPEVTRRFRQMQHGDAVIYIMAQSEASNAHMLWNLGRLVSLLPVVLLPGEGATAYGEIRAALEARGEMDRWPRSLDCCSRQIRGTHSRHQQ